MKTIMKLDLTELMDNSTSENQERAKLARILRNLAAMLEYGEFIATDIKLPLVDLNGNIIGYLTFQD